MRSRLTKSTRGSRDEQFVRTARAYVLGLWQRHRMLPVLRRRGLPQGPLLHVRHRCHGAGDETAAYARRLTVRAACCDLIRFLIASEFSTSRPWRLGRLEEPEPSRR